jgi:hypothetical protein
VERLETADHLHLHSDRLALVFEKSRPVLDYLGVSSGGRGRDHLDRNLLRPGAGGRFTPAGTDIDGRGCRAELLADGIAYHGVSAGDGRRVDCALRMPDESTLLVTLASSGADIAGRWFSLSFAPDVTPPSTWAQPVSWTPRRSADSATWMTPEIISRDFHAPALVSLPDFGLLRIETDDPGAILCEELVPDPANTGLNHGWSNAMEICARKAYHHGEVVLRCSAGSPCRRLELRFVVRDEIEPAAAGCDFRDARWNGLRRCWMNSFTLNPPTLSLGDNPILDGLGHLAIHWKADMALYTPEMVPGLGMHAFLRNTLDLTFRERTDPAGAMSGYGWENGGCNLIALHAYLAGTGDWEFARGHLPTVRRIVERALAADADDDGILEAAFHGNFNDDLSGKASLNWWDALGFGHKDGYANLVYHQALRRIREVLSALGQQDLVERVDRFLAKTRANFHRQFYNPATGVYAGWISRDGRMHDYYFTFITAMAVIEDLVPDTGTARAMLGVLLAKLDENGYGSFRYGVPGMATPVDEADRITWPPMADWGNYLHGGFCGVVAYPFLMALYRVGMRDTADRILFSMLRTFETLPTHSGLHPGFGIGRSWDWRTRDGLPSGYNYLADNYVFLLAAIQGHFGVALPVLAEPPRE